MKRGTHQFRSRQPFAKSGDDNLTLQHAKGPVAFLNPTQRVFSHSAAAAPFASSAADGAEPVDDSNGDANNATEAGKGRKTDGIHYIWRSRDNRKGRHPLQVQKPRHNASASTQVVAPRPSSHPREVWRGIVRTFTKFPVWDISWLVAFIFTLGSIVWVINGFFAWLPVERPSSEFKGEGYWGGGITALIGAILFFETGSLLLILEAINANDTGCFGWAVEELVDKQDAAHQHSHLQFTAQRDLCSHHHQNKHNLVGRPQLPRPDAPARHWQWCPSWHDLRHHYLYELGFLAGAAQLFGATVFGVAGFTALPGIADHLHPQWRLNAAYWIPQVVGGCGFIVSGMLYMLETQERWWKPAPRLLGWHVAFWNLVGAVGFTMCGALGMAYGSEGAQYQAALATFWGSWAFLIGSYLQLYESLSKHPVEEVKRKVQ